MAVCNETFQTDETRHPYVPKCYTKISCTPHIVDLGGMAYPEQRSILVQEVANACCRHGFFQLATEEKAEYMSGDVQQPVRYGTSVKDGVDQAQFWRVILKHYAHPLNKWIHLWPHSPPDYKEKMGEYVEALQSLVTKVMGLVTESLGLGATFLSKKMEEGMQVMAVNRYPAWPQPQQALGLPPHTDYGCLTLVLQVFDTEKRWWMEVPMVDHALQVHVGDQLEVLSNDKPRISIAGLHAMGMDVKVGPAAGLVDEQHPNGYRESSFGDFLEFISRNDLGAGRGFLDTLKIVEK